MIYLQLLYEFFKIGLFSFGGGYATIPFLYHISYTYEWYSIPELIHMIAIASITPGPVGINVATYAGLKTAGLIGAFVATISEMFPSFFLVIIISKILKNYGDNFYISSLIKTLKPISCALLLAVVFGLVKLQINDLKALTLLIILLLISWKSKKDPLFYIILSGFVGMLKVVIF